MPELRIIGDPGTETWKLIGSLFGKSATIYERTGPFALIYVLRERARLERADA